MIGETQGLAVWREDEAGPYLDLYPLRTAALVLGINIEMGCATESIRYHAYYPRTRPRGI